MAEKNEEKAKADRTALITEMLAASKTASDRWNEVCRVYDEAWKAAFDSHVGVLGKLATIKAVREQAKVDRLKTCFELAFVFLPIVGGPAAIFLAPILSARAKLFANTMERKAQAAWSGFAARRPIVSEVVKEIGTRSAKEAQDAAAKIQEGIIDILAPKHAPVAAPPPKTTPVEAFKANNSLTRGAMNVWVQSCARWNVNGGWERELVPVAYDLFLNHPWIKKAPPEQTTQALQAPLTLFIEMALWLRWARTLNEEYWRKIHDWYLAEYSGASRDGKNGLARSVRRNWVIDALDFSVVWEHLRRVFPKGYRFHGMTLLDPESGLILAERVTIDLYLMIKKAKHSSSRHLLADLLPGASIDSDLSRELANM